MEKRGREDMVLKVPNAGGNVWTKQVCPTLRQELVHPKGCNSAGIADIPTFIWINPERWVQVFAIGQKDFELKKDKFPYNIIGWEAERYSS